MASTDNQELRNLLLEAAKKNKFDVDVLQEKETKLKNIMREYQMDSNQSQSLEIIGVREWILQGPQLAKFPSEIFFHITSFVVGLSKEDTEKVFEAINKKLFFDSLVGILGNYKQLGLFSTEKYFRRAASS